MGPKSCGSEKNLGKIVEVQKICVRKFFGSKQICVIQNTHTQRIHTCLILLTTAVYEHAG